VVNQWWASIVAAKQAMPANRAALSHAGFPEDADPYSSQGLAALCDPAGEPPWGGLPRPDILETVRSPDHLVGLFEAWAEQAGATLLCFDRSIESREDFPVDWWDQLPDHWDEALEPERLDLMVAQLQNSISHLERHT